MAESLGFESMVINAYPDHLLMRKQTVRTRDLEGEEILISRVDCSDRISIEQILKREGISRFGRLESHGVEAIKWRVGARGT